MKSLLCIGHVTYDTFLSVTDDLQSERICYSFGSKIPVDKVYYSAGGGAANVAVGVKKLEISTSVYSIAGDDIKGKEIKLQLEKAGVDLSNLVFDSNPTDQSAIISYSKDRVIFSYNFPRTYSLVDVPLTFSAIYLSSVGNDVSGLYGDISKLKKNNPDILIFYTPGSRELKMARDSIADFINSVDYLIVNLEEGVAILDPALSISSVQSGDLLKLLQEKGAKNVVVTNGEKGSFAISEDSEIFEMPAIKSNVVEKTGAGDAYASGFIASIFHGFEVEEGMRWGTRNSSAVIQIEGAQNGLLSKSEIMKV